MAAAGKTPGQKLPAPAATVSARRRRTVRGNGASFSSGGRWVDAPERRWHNHGVKTLTLSLPDSVYDSAAQQAAERNIPLEQLVSEIVARQAQQVTPEEFERLEKLQQELFAKP